VEVMAEDSGNDEGGDRRGQGQVRAKGHRHRTKGIETQSWHSRLAGSLHSQKHTEIKGEYGTIVASYILWLSTKPGGGIYM